MHPACASRAVREAAAVGNVGEVIRLVRRAHGLNQRQLGAATGRSQSTISRIERGGSGTRDVEILRRLGTELDIPLVLLGLAEHSSQNKHSTTIGEFPVDRRDFLFSAAAVIPSTAVAGTVIAEDEAAATVHAIATAHRRLDATTSSRDLVEPVAAHLRMATGMQAKIWDPMSRTPMAAAVSEVAGLAGWLYWDMHDLGSARRHYRIAVEQAQRAGGDSMLTAYMLGSLASFVVVQEGAADEGLVLLRHAAKVAQGERPATADAWLAAMEAVAHASAGDNVQTWRALDRAEAAVERVAAEETPPWPWVFPFDARKIATYRAHLRRAAAASRCCLCGRGGPACLDDWRTP
ncbi:MAG TPA: helix-turn-helix domain-containing protein [Pseudonocardiaceae bacterium]|nr:helix-turn-helix domain-containing protein [Pseudonocardiaceae bacterium]